MKLLHIQSGLKLVVSRQLYYKEYRGSPHIWKDITPEPTEKQKAVQKRFVNLGKLTRTKANMQDVIRTFGGYHGLFVDTVIALNNLIERENNETLPENSI